NGHTLIAYDKSSHLKIFSTNLTRIELRLTTQLASWNVKNFMSDKNSYDKLVGKIEHYFQERMRLYSNDRLTRYIINMDIKSALGDFIAFVHGDVYKYKDHFRVEEAINKRDTFFDWMKTNKLTPKKMNNFVKGRRAAVCLDLGFSSKTFKKAVNFYKAIPNFKF
ncbi:MAG: hypothetical protein U9P38_06915, partial [Campylobacterota bacterium]|nr:hypothetical protein [Campylobacterota bacterium]